MCLICATIPILVFNRDSIIMQKTTFVRARIEPKIKNKAEHILEELGITSSQAISMLYRTIIREHGWPIELKLPNSVTRKTLEDTDKGENLVESKNAKDMFGKLGI